ncbi:hypothetical protein [Halosimplex pelagicum]|uniref:Uncharacterized protein n=1 Tax=Halosimplex pelagicum TaxID=869886 RepID=A0A7D5T9Z8_9EURY|nr:hypothetical protein [Halosimplex pelagicum]QLH80893.1 hypothetical protein HZS54_04225 [Halosimplex pelagicum]
MRGLSDRGQSQLRAYYRGIRGTRGGSDTGLEALTDGGRAEFREALNDETITGRTLAQFRRGNSDRTWRELFDRDVCNSPCDPEFEVTYELAGKLDGLDVSDAKQLEQSLIEYRKTIGDDSEFTSPDDLLERLRELEEQDIDGLGKAINERKGGVQNIKGLDGETETVENLLDDGVDPDTIEMERDIGDGDLPDLSAIDSDKSNREILEDEFGFELKEVETSDTDIDVDVDGGVAYESKTNVGPGAAPYPGATDVVANDVISLRNKLRTLAASGEKKIVVVTRTESDIELSDGAKAELRASGEPGWDSLREMADDVESNSGSVFDQIRNSDEVSDDVADSLPQDVEIVFKKPSEVSNTND